VRGWQRGPSFATGYPPETELVGFAGHFVTALPEQLLCYWRGKCHSRDIPVRDEIHPSEMKPLLERLSIWERCPKGRDNRIRLIGTLAAELFDHDPSGRRISEVLPAEWVQMHMRLNHALYEEKRPLYLTYNLTPLGRPHVMVEHLALPLRRAGSKAELSIHVFARIPSRSDQTDGPPAGT